MFAGRLATTTTNASAAGEYKGRVLIVTFFSAKRLDPLYDFSTHTHIQKEKQIPRPVERLKKLLKNGFFFFFLLLSLKSFQMMRDWIIQGICDISPPSTYTLRWFPSGEEGGCDDHLFPVGSYEQDAVWKEKMMVEAIQRVDGLMRKQIMSLSLSLSPRYRRRETGVTHNGEIAKEKESSWRRNGIRLGIVSCVQQLLFLSPNQIPFWFIIIDSFGGSSRGEAFCLHQQQKTSFKNIYT